MSQNKYYYIWKYIETKGTRPTLDALEFIPSVGMLGLINIGDAYIDKKPRFKKSEMHRDLPSQRSPPRKFFYKCILQAAIDFAELR
jgi:hypothetical protein